jgi:Flp pilus assembly protein TadD
VAASGIVSRPRIEQLLAGAWERRITLTVAGGGYGKTTALRQLAASRPASWLALTAADRETEVLSAHVAAAIGLASDRGVADTAAAIGASDRQSLAEGQATRHLRRLLERDPYDADAWTALLAAQLRLRRYGEARRQHAIYARRMSELDVPPVPLARITDS